MPKLTTKFLSVQWLTVTFAVCTIVITTIICCALAISSGDSALDSTKEADAAALSDTRRDLRTINETLLSNLDKMNSTLLASILRVQHSQAETASSLLELSSSTVLARTREILTAVGDKAEQEVQESLLLMSYHMRKWLSLIATYENPSTWEWLESLIPAAAQDKLTYGLPDAFGTYTCMGFYVFATATESAKAVILYEDELTVMNPPDGYHHMILQIDDGRNKPATAPDGGPLRGACGSFDNPATTRQGTLHPGGVFNTTSDPVHDTWFTGSAYGPPSDEPSPRGCMRGYPHPTKPGETCLGSAYVDGCRRLAPAQTEGAIDMGVCNLEEYCPAEDTAVMIAKMLVNAGEFNVMPLTPIGNYMGATALGVWGKDGVKLGAMGLMADIRSFSVLLGRTAGRVGDGTSRARVWITVRDYMMKHRFCPTDPQGCSLMGQLLDQENGLVAASHGRTHVDVVDDELFAWKVRPDPCPGCAPPRSPDAWNWKLNMRWDINSTDPLIRAAARWIRGGSTSRYSETGYGAYSGDITEFLVTSAMAGPGWTEQVPVSQMVRLTDHLAPFFAPLETQVDALPAELDGQAFFLQVREIADGIGNEWWLSIIIDRQYVLGAIDAETAATHRRITEENQQIQRDIQRENDIVTQDIIKQNELSARLTEETDRSIRKSQDDVDEAQAQDRVVLYVVVIAVIVFLVFVSVAFAHAITQPMRRLQSQMQDVATMQLDQIDEQGTKSQLSEIAKMQRSFMGMVRNMKELRNYMPQSLLARDDGEADEEEVADSPEKDAAHKQGSQVEGYASGVSKRRRKVQDGGSTVASSQKTMAMRAYLKRVAGDGLRKKRVTIFVVNVVDIHAILSGTKHAETIMQFHCGFIQSCLSCVTRSRGVADTFSGDRFNATFNAVTPLGVHRTAVCHAALAIQTEMCSSDVDVQYAGGQNVDASARSETPMVVAPATSGADSQNQAARSGKPCLTMAAGTGECQLGNLGCPGLKKFAILSPVATFTYALERFGRSIGSELMVVDAGVNEDAKALFFTRCVGMISFEKRSKKPIKVVEIVASKKALEEEWMYSVEEEGAARPYQPWDDCVAAMQTGNWAAAEAAMQQLGDKGVGGSGKWLRKQLRERASTLDTTILFH